MIKQYLWIVAALLASLTSTTANALIMTVESGFNLGYTVNEPGSGSASQVISVPGFDSSLGTLVGAEFRYFGTGYVDAAASVQATSGGGVLLTHDATLSYSILGLTAYDIPINATGGCAANPQQIPECHGAASNDQVLGRGAILGTIDPIPIDENLVVLFALAGTFDASYNGVELISGSLSAQARAVGQLRVDYEYTEFATSAVPIPAAIWLFGTALLGLVGVSRRRKAN